MRYPKTKFTVPYTISKTRESTPLPQKACSLAALSGAATKCVALVLSYPIRKESRRGRDLSAQIFSGLMMLSWTWARERFTCARNHRRNADCGMRIADCGMIIRNPIALGTYRFAIRIPQSAFLLQICWIGSQIDVLRRRKIDFRRGRLSVEWSDRFRPTHLGRRRRHGQSFRCGRERWIGLSKLCVVLARFG